MLNRIMPTVSPSRNGTPNPAYMAYLSWLANEDTERSGKVKEYRDYYEGNHKTQLTARMRAFLQIGTNSEFTGNYCPIVVDALAERLKVAGFDAGDQGGTFGDNEEAGIFIDWWNRNRGDALQIDVHNAAVREGDTYVIVEWDNEGEYPCWSHEMAYDGSEGVKVHYSKDKRNKIAFATKRWRVADPHGGMNSTMRLNVYTDDAIYKYASKGGTNASDWAPYEVEGEDWPLRWVGSDGLPLGVPVVHFKNNPKGYNDGISEMDKVIPLQNALNKSLIDLIATADVAAFRMFTMTGDDPTGITIAPGSFIYAENPDATIDVIDGMDMRPMIAVVDSFVTRIAQVSRTPLSYFQASAQIASDDTQRANDSGLVSKAQDRAVSFGNAWEDVLEISRRLHNTFGEGQLDDEPISCLWEDFEIIDKMARRVEQSTVIGNLVAAGASLYAAARAAGMSEADALALYQTDVPASMGQ